MNISLKNLLEIKGGLSKKKVFRKAEKKINKIIIDFSADSKEFDNYLKINKILSKINIAIPKVYEVHVKKKIIVIEDFGNKNFNKIINEKDLFKLLKLAVDSLIVIQNSIHKDDLYDLEKYTFSELRKEISEFVDYYLPYKKVTNFNINNFYEIWEKIYDKQNFKFNSFVHKDFEFINLILLNNNNLHLRCGIIDFQSAFIGFKGWDLFSLLEFPRVNFTRKYNEDLIKYFYENITYSYDFESFRNQYYILNLARLTRLLGRWIKLSNKENNHYLNFIDPTKERLCSCLKNIKDQNLKNMYKKVL
tara:strand:+ start:583 stop:1497 length:915 start_codon:yes stop_codon:yes gene_type:complete